VEIGVVVTLECEAVGWEFVEFFERLWAADVIQVLDLFRGAKSVDERFRKVIVSVRNDGDDEVVRHFGRARA
jgi:hypothetical protein